MKLEFHPEAELELIEAADFYEQEVPGLGERFESEVHRATDLLLAHRGRRTSKSPTGLLAVSI